jgi:hypothetical protein
LTNFAACGWSWCRWRQLISKQPPKLCDASAAPLRAGDALHLAVCRRVRGSLATMDKGLAAAGQEAGMVEELIQA